MTESKNSKNKRAVSEHENDPVVIDSAAGDPAANDPVASDSAAWKFIAAFLIVTVLIIGGSLLFSKIKTDSFITENSYNGFQFMKSSDGFWVTEVNVKGQPYFIPFYYHPRETEDIVFQWDVADQIVDSPVKPDVVYISLDPDAGSRPVIAAVELSRLFGTRYKLLNMEVHSALTRPADGLNAETPIITCEDATPGVLVIIFKESADSAVTNVGNCVTVHYTDGEDSIRVADRFGFELLKIM